MTQDYIAEAITEHWGERCPDYVGDCPTCTAWKQYDDLRATVAEAGWRTMDSAPKDGTWIIAWREPAAKGRREPFVIVRWCDDDAAWAWPDDVYDPFTDVGRDRANRDIAEGHNYADRDGFTHWMPRPAEPATAKHGGSNAAE